MQESEERNSEEGNREKAKEKSNEGSKKEENELPLMALNHVSRLCKNVKDSVDFYTKFLGFVLIERPSAFDFDGAWLFNYGVEIHLVHSKGEDRLPDTDHLDPMDYHISFQCEDMEAIERRLKEFNVRYMKRTMEDDESGSAIDQLFFQ